MKRLVILLITIVSLGLFSTSAWAIAKEAQNAPDFYDIYEDGTSTKQDIDKAIHFAKLAIELDDKGVELPNVGLAYSYCKANKFSQMQTNIIVNVIKEDYNLVIRYCNQLIK